MQRFHNLYPGPSALPDAVIQKIQDSLWQYKPGSVSSLELYHRGDEIKNLIRDIKNNLYKLLKLPSFYSLLLFEGGAMSQFHNMVINLQSLNKKMGYVVTGRWGTVAFEQGQKILKERAEILYTNEPLFKTLPSAEFLQNLETEDYSGIYLTSNNTVHGTQFHDLPRFKAPLIIDATSDIMQRSFDFENNNIGILFASCQKNLGIAGLTVVAVRNDLILEDPTIPSLLSYHFHQQDPITHTIPTFNVFVTKLMLDWISEQGGVDHFHKTALRKSNLIYEVIDRYPEFYRSLVTPSSRSSINIPLTLPNKELEAQFIKKAHENNFQGLEGHPTKGGMRFSMYNSFEEKAALKLANFMEEFYREHKNF